MTFDGGDPGQAWRYKAAADYGPEVEAAFVRCEAVCRDKGLTPFRCVAHRIGAGGYVGMVQSLETFPNSYGHARYAALVLVSEAGEVVAKVC